MRSRCSTIFGMLTTALLSVICGTKPPHGAPQDFRMQPRTTHLTHALATEQQQRLCVALHISPRRLRQLLAEKPRDQRTADSTSNAIVAGAARQQSAAVLWME